MRYRTIKTPSMPASVTVADVEQAARTIFLRRGDRVTLVGFGTFSTSQRKLRTGRNPKAGAPVKMAAKKVAKFSPGARLKAAVRRKK